MSQHKTPRLDAAPAQQRLPRTSQGGFTFVELLSVAFCLGMLPLVLLPSLARVRQRTIQTSCAANLRQIGVALHLYAQANHDTLPGPVFDLAQPGYDQASNRELSWFLAQQLGYPKPSRNLGVARELICPAQPKRASDFTPRQGQASYVVSAGLEISKGSRVYPFGQIGEPGIPPLKLSTLAALGPVARMKAITDADKANANPTLQGWGGLPPRPVHGSARNQLYLDGHVAENRWE